MDLPAYAVVGASAADLLTTELALADGCCHEINPLMREPAVRVLWKTGATVIVLKGTKALKHRGHPGWAKGLRWGTAVIWTGAAAWNVRQMRGH